MIYLIILGYLLSGVLAYGLCLHGVRYGFDRSFNRRHHRQDKRLSLLFGISGPIGLIAVSIAQFLEDVPFRLEFK